MNVLMGNNKNLSIYKINKKMKLKLKILNNKIQIKYLKMIN